MESSKKTIPIVLIALLASLLVALVVVRSCTRSDMKRESVQSTETIVESSLASKAGQYEIVAMVTEGEETAPEDLALLKSQGLTCTITLEADGTGTLNLFGEETSLTWDDTTISTAEKSMSYTYRDNQLVVTDGDSSLTFSRTA